MVKKIERPPLTTEEVAEKRRLRDAYLRYKSRWESVHGESLTQSRLGEVAAEVIGRADPFTQGAVWQQITCTSATKLTPEFVQAVAKLLDFPVDEVSPRFNPIVNAGPFSLSPADGLTDPDIQSVVQLMLKGTPAQRRKAREMLALLLGDQE